MALKKNSFTYVKHRLRSLLRVAHRENMALGRDASIVPRERAATRIELLEELCKEFDVHTFEIRRCQCGVCSNLFPNLGAGRRYCCDACRQKAYRDRHFI